MVLVDIRGVEVDFPFEPYSCQKVYMEKVITCLQERRHGILESPTGTGKTLSLLCATLAWRQNYASQRLQEDASRPDFFQIPAPKSTGSGSKAKSKSGGWTSEEKVVSIVPKIVYASRTHSQLSQVVGELKASAYEPNISILGSREQLCINRSVRRAESLTEKIHMCRAKVAARSCIYHNRFEEKKSDPVFRENIMDIEDLVSLGTQHSVCPYFMARELRDGADITFMPYNYVLDQKTRQAFGIDLKNTIVILDEAHNVEKMCEESSSFTLTSTDIAASLSNLSKCIQYASTSREGMPPEAAALGKPVVDDEKDFIALKRVIMNFEQALDDTVVPADGLTLPGRYIYELFMKCGVTFMTKAAILEMCDKALTLLTKSSFNGKSFALQKFSDAIRTVFGNIAPGVAGQLQAASSTDLSLHYKVHITVDKKSVKPKKSGWSSSDSSSPEVRVLSYWCFSPGRAMSELVRQGVHSLILTSGTLSPLDSFSAEMNIQFDVQLQNPHVIHGDQIFVGVLSKGPSGEVLRSTYERRSVAAYKTDLGNSIVNIARVVPNGMLVFFPSYPAMADCIEHWKENYGIWDRINSLKPAFTEPRNKADFNATIEGFYSKIHDEQYRCAAFFAVCRGKVSEGLDFADYNGRAVVITGLPFPPRYDARVKLKMDYLEECCRRRQPGDPEVLSGDKWYRQQASRAVNQAIGRVIRHRKDFGAIILCDERFGRGDVQGQLPRWVRPHVRTFNVFSHLARELPKFYTTAEELVGAPIIPLSCPSQPLAESADSFMDKIVIPQLPGGSRAPRDGAALLPAALERENFVPSLARPRKRPHTQIEYDQFQKKAAKPKSALTSLSVSDPVREQAESAPNPPRINIYGPSSPKVKKSISFSDKILECDVPFARQQRSLKVVRPCIRLPKKEAPAAPAQSPHKVGGIIMDDKLREKQKRAHNYLQKVREFLKHDKAAYPALVAQLQCYKAGKDVHALFRAMSSAMPTLDIYPVLYDFAPFLRQEHVETYQKLCEKHYEVLCKKNSTKTSGQASSSLSDKCSSLDDPQYAALSLKNCKSLGPESKDESASKVNSASKGHDTARRQLQSASKEPTLANKDHNSTRKEHDDSSRKDHISARKEPQPVSKDHGREGKDHTSARKEPQPASEDHGQEGKDHTSARKEPQPVSKDHGREGKDHTSARKEPQPVSEDHNPEDNDYDPEGKDYDPEGKDYDPEGRLYESDDDDDLSADPEPELEVDDYYAMPNSPLSQFDEEEEEDDTDYSKPLSPDCYGYPQPQAMDIDDEIQHDVDSSQDAITIGPNGIPTFTMEPPDSKYNIPVQTHLPEGQVCEKCKKKPSLFEAPCKHVCCLPCWRTQLKVEKKCVVCDQHVRSKNLRKIYFC